MSCRIKHLTSNIQHQTFHIFLLAVLLSSCTPRAVREAQEVVAHADSLREAHLYAQNEYDDSLSLAQAYETLKEIPLPFREGLGLGSSYAHACYHYGRMLRAKDNYVEAMKVFIDATRSRTRDYHILGRVYSNVAEMCHLAGEYQLSYDMFAKCADCFLQKGDSSNYFYALNRMAFELAEQGKKEETLVLLDSIARNCNDKNVILKTWETKAEMYRKISQYDSTSYYSNKLINAGYITSFAYVLKAWALEHTGKKDSATLYAKYIIQMPSASVQEQYNMLYILSNYDTTLTKAEVLELSAKRADLGHDRLDPLHTQYTMAVEILQKDLTREPDLRWLYSTIGTLVLISFGLFFYVRKKHRKRELLSQQIEELENRNNDTIAKISAQIENNIALLSQSANLKEDLCWSDYNKLCVIINQQVGMLALKLQKTYKLSEREIRLCILTMLNLGYDEIADMLYYAPNGVGKLKLRVAKKLGTTSKNLHHFLLLIAVHEQQD